MSRMTVAMVGTSIALGMMLIAERDALAAGANDATISFFLPPTNRVPRPTDVSDDGQTVVGGSFLIGLPHEAFIWRPSSGYEVIPGMETARAVSSDGTIVVGIGPELTAVRWTAEAGIEVLRSLPGGDGSAVALAMSPDGSIVVGGSSSAEGPSEAFRILNGGAPEALGDLPGGVFSSNAYGVSADGSVVVGDSFVTQFQHQPFRWDPVNGMQQLPLLAGFDINNDATAVSEDGAVIVGSIPPNSVRWMNGTVEALGFIGDEVTSAATAVSADGSVIVGNAVGREAFIWTEAGGMQSLNQVATDAGADLGLMHLVFATGISANGRHIVGAASLNDPENPKDILSVGFRLTLPASCPPDLDGSGDVGFGDLLAVLSNWGPCAECPEDLNHSGAVDFADLLLVLSAWGNCGAV